MTPTTGKCRRLVLKIASRCNLNCTYCYMYNLGDKTYRNQPKVMSQEVVLMIIKQVNKHCLDNNIDNFTFIFHGGEPLLAGEDFFVFFVEQARKLLDESINPMFVVQTNGVLLTDNWCKLFGKLNIGVGISLDGTPEVNDKFRIDHAGRGSYQNIIKGIKIAQQSIYLKDTPLGLLSVIDIKSDPIEVYQHLSSLQAPNIDFLIPDANYESLPQGYNQETFIRWETPYADWLIKIFDIWFYEKKPSNIRIFESIILLILGKTNNLDTFGTEDNEVLVIETDGSIEPIGQLKICEEGITKLSKNVLYNSIDEALEEPLIKLYGKSGSTLCTQCEQCTVREICAGGYLPHRYSEHNGFDNPSVYCHDLLKLIIHIQNKLFEKLSTDELYSFGIHLMSFREEKNHLQSLETTQRILAREYI